MIGDTSEEMYAFYIGVIVGMYLMFKIALLIVIIKHKYYHRNELNNASKTEHI